VKNDKASFAIYHHSEFGPSFGGGKQGCDLVLCYQNNQSGINFSNLGQTYEATTIPNLVSAQPGFAYFTVADYEVFAQ
jgi:hypothetical protein